MTSHRVIDPRRSVRGVVRWGIVVVRKAWWVAAIGLLAAGAVANLDRLTEGHLGPLATNSEVAAGEAGLATPADDFDTFPGVGYAGTGLALLDARVIRDARSGFPIVVAEVAVRNSTSVQTRLPLNMVNLLGPDGLVAELDRFDFTEHGSRLVVEPGRTERALAVFKLRVHSSLELSDYQLQFGEPGRWPVNLPLDGPLVPAVHPQPLEITFSEPGARYRGLTVELTEATTALEYGVYRAAIGQHLAVVTVTVTGSPAGSSSTIERDLWTLIDGEAERRAIRALPGLRPIGGNSVTMELVFGYGNASSDLTLMVGPPGDRRPVAEFRVQTFE